MSDRPILFSASMVRALLAGTKTQTRRVIKPRGENSLFAPGMWADSYVLDPGNAEWRSREIPFAVGDRLWVREEYYQTGHWWQKPGALTKGGKPKWQFVPASHHIRFDPQMSFLTARPRVEDGEEDGLARIRWYKRLGRFMPRRYSRLTLTVTDVRVERLQDISEEHAIAEGIYCTSLGLGGLYSIDRPGDKARDGATITRPAGWEKASHAYCHLWERINGKDSWDANPWVVAVSFDVRQVNIDA